MTDLLHNWVNQHRRLQNYMAASRELKLTPQEQYAYRHHLGNLERGGVPHPDGSLSSFLNQILEFDGRYYILPSVWDNRIVNRDEVPARKPTNSALFARHWEISVCIGLCGGKRSHRQTCLSNKIPC